MGNKNAVKKYIKHYSSVTHPRSEPSFPSTDVTHSYFHTHTHTLKSGALRSLAAEVQMVCLYASLTQRCSFTFSLLCLLLLDSVHQCSTSLTPLSFALLSPPLPPVPPLPPLCNTSLCPLFITLSIFPTCDLFSLPPRPRGPQTRLAMNE